MVSKFTPIRIGLLLMLLVITSSVGCARLEKKRRCSSSPVQCTPKCPTAKETLRIISFESRNLIQLSNVTDPIEGTPIAANPTEDLEGDPTSPEQLRDLTIEELWQFSAKAAPIANRIEAHRDWLCTLERTPPAIINALTHQARYERGQHLLRSEEAYLNLVRVYTKPPILTRTTDILLESEEAIDRLREAGVEIPGDPFELPRRRLEITEQLIEVRYNQLRLNDGLETLLNLTHSKDEPIWPNFQGQTRPTVPSESTAIQKGLSQRGDLIALELLAANSETLSVDFLRGGDPSAPLIGAGFELPGPARWWQCILKDKIEALKQTAQCERKRQLEMLAENKRDQIRLEIRESLRGIERHEANLQVKLARIDNLRQSMQSADRAKDLRPVDFTTRLQQRTDELRLISEIVDELVSIEIEHARLFHAQGN